MKDIDKVFVTNTMNPTAQIPSELFGNKGAQHPLAKFVDYSETYGAHIVERFVRSLAEVRLAADLGAGTGRDLEMIKRVHKNATTVAIEAGREYAGGLQGKVDQIHVANIEKDVLPFADETVDLIIANQILEHTKEVFWIFNEVTRSLKVGGHFLFGVPNIASFHNRVLLLFGGHPTQHKLCSPHVRPFSKNDTLKFLQVCFPGGYQVEGFAGSQFYPFPRPLARVLSSLFPTASFSIFFLLRKMKPFRNEFVTYPGRARFETNFWTGTILAPSQYDDRLGNGHITG